MSISDELKLKTRHGKLLEHEPRIRGPIHRPLYLTAAVDAAIRGPWPLGSDSAKDMPHVEALLDSFVQGDALSGSFDASPRVELRRLRDRRPLVWEFRVTRPKHFRIFGFFACQDVFVGMSIKDRTGIDWPTEKALAIAAWEKLLPGYSPLLSGNQNDYVSQNFTFF